MTCKTHVLSSPLFISFKTNIRFTPFSIISYKPNLLTGGESEHNLKEEKQKEFVGKMSGNDIRDEAGNPIVLTDEHGNPVLLRDQHGNRIRIRGTAIKLSAADVDLIGKRGEHVAGTGLLSSTTTGRPIQHEATKFAEENAEVQRRQQEQRVEEHDLRPEGVLQRTASSSSSSSSEDDGQGGRIKKKKGLTQKLKEKLTIGRHKEEHPEHLTTGAATTAAPGEHHEHEKKGMMEKIKEKLPMHHNHQSRQVS